MEFDIDHNKRRKSKTPKKGNQSDNRYSFISSEGENINMNEHYSDDGNLRLKMEKTKNITYLKSHYHYDG